MESLRQIGAGFLLGAIFLAIVVGGFALARVEGDGVPASATTQSPTPVMPTVDTGQNSTQPVPIITSTLPSILNTDTPAPELTAAPTITPPPPPVSCHPPSGWIAIFIQPYDSLTYLAAVHQTTPDALRQGNCLVSEQLVPGSFLYVPPQPKATAIPCGAPASWINYYVLPGDTLYRISQLYRVSVQDLQRANCLGSSDVIKAGQKLKVPNVATSSIPSIIITMAIPSATPTLTTTPTESLPAPTNTEVPSATTAPTETGTPPIVAPTEPTAPQPSPTQ